MAYKPQRPPDFWPRQTGDDPFAPNSPPRTTNSVTVRGKTSALRWLRQSADAGAPPPGTNAPPFGGMVGENRPAFDGWMARFRETDAGFNFGAPPPEPEPAIAPAEPKPEPGKG